MPRSLAGVLGPCQGVPDLPDLPGWGLFHSSSEAEAQVLELEVRFL
jgi:hypothetical protein